MPAMKLVQAVTRRPKRGVRFTIADNQRDLSAAASCHVRRSNKLERVSHGNQKRSYRLISILIPFLRLLKLAKHLQKDEQTHS